MFKTTVTKQPKQICHGWWQPSSWEKGWLITSLTHMFCQKSRTKWDQFRSAVECLRDSFLSQTLISAPQISCLSLAADGHRGKGRASGPRRVNNISITRTKLAGGRRLGEHRPTRTSDVSFRAIRPNAVFFLYIKVTPTKHWWKHAPWVALWSAPNTHLWFASPHWFITLINRPISIKSEMLPRARRPFLSIWLTATLSDMRHLCDWLPAVSLPHRQGSHFGKSG